MPVASASGLPPHPNPPSLLGGRRGSSSLVIRGSGRMRPGRTDLLRNPGNSCREEFSAFRHVIPLRRRWRDPPHPCSSLISSSQADFSSSSPPNARPPRGQGTWHDKWFPSPSMKIILGDSVRLPLTAEPVADLAIPAEYETTPAGQEISHPQTSPSGLAAPKAASPHPLSIAEQAFEEPFEQFDELLSPLGSSALSDWPL